jgi:Short C-terminal domain
VTCTAYASATCFPFLPELALLLDLGRAESPLPGKLAYLIARGGKMHEHAVQQAQHQEEQLRSYVQEAAGSQSTADQLAKLADLRDRGVITAEEFDREKPQDPGLSPTSTGLASSAIFAAGD